MLFNGDFFNNQTELLFFVVVVVVIVVVAYTFPFLSSSVVRSFCECGRFGAFR